MHKSKFFLQFLTKGTKVGSMVPSSPFLAMKMMQYIPFNNARNFVELGPGTGVFTTQLLERMHADSRLILVELNSLFYQELVDTISDPRVVIVHGSVLDLEKILKEQNMQQVDCILSSLPLSIFPNDLAVNILNLCKDCLKKEGLFIQFQYSLKYRKKLNGLYRNIKLEFTPLNFPPAFIYSCTK